MGASKRSKSAQPSYSALEPRVKHVSETTIRKKWKKLPISSQDRIKELLLSLKQQSAVDRGKVNTSINSIDSSVAEITDKLMERLPKMPFPPSTDEQQFDYEATIQRISNLEYQLTDNIHSVALLRAQIAKEEDLLKQDKMELKTLQVNMKSAEGLQKRQEKTLHPLAQTADLEGRNHRNVTTSEDGFDGGAQRSSETNMSSDPELDGLLSQLRNHLENMQANTANVQQIARAIEGAQATLDIFSYQTLERDKYGQMHSIPG